MSGVVATLDIMGGTGCSRLEGDKRAFCSRTANADWFVRIRGCASKELLLRLSLHCCFLFVFTAAASLRYHVVDVLHDLVQRSIGAGTDDGLDKYAEAALMYHGVDDSHVLVNSSSDRGN